MESGGETSELERLRLKNEELVNESLESTRRMEQLCQETRETATGVLVTLDGQGGERARSESEGLLNISQNVTEQLDNIEAGIDKMGADMKKAEQHLREMTDNPIKRLFRRRR